MLCAQEILSILLSSNTKKPNALANILGPGRKRKTTKRIDQAIQRKVKVDRRKSASSVRHEIAQRTLV